MNNSDNYKIIILDFATGVVHTFDYDNLIYADEEIQVYFDMLNIKFGLDLLDSNCHWMITQELIVINH